MGSSSGSHDYCSANNFSSKLVANITLVMRLVASMVVRLASWVVFS